MGKEVYPTGVENHGGSLRIWFKYKNQRVRENLGVPDTAKNRKVAGELRASVCFAIKMGSFDYISQFPDSVNLKKFGIARKDLTIRELSEKWLELKKLEISENAHYRYKSAVNNMVPLLGGSRLISSVTKEDLMFIRRELLNGNQKEKARSGKPVKGRSVVTVNYYLTITGSMFQFASESGYLLANPFSTFKPLKKAKPEPDPFSHEEFLRLTGACRNRQIKNFWTIAFYTGVRHGELVSLAWEDVDLKAGTLAVRRNLTMLDDFTLPKTEASTDRVIHLVEPALDALRDQAELSRLGKQHLVKVKLREYGRTTTHPCTFIFSPSISNPGMKERPYFLVGALRYMWESLIKRSGLRYRKAYQSRHTYACWLLTAGANPNFIAQQMGHASAQMVYSVYGAWMPESNVSQVEFLNRTLKGNAPHMPHQDIVKKINSAKS